MKIFKLFKKLIRYILRTNDISKLNFRFIKLHNKKIFFINSYPRSGNTWMRLIIGKILIHNFNIQISNKKSILLQISKIICDIEVDDLQLKHNKKKRFFFKITLSL